MDPSEFAKLLMHERRKETEDPQKIAKQIGIKGGSVLADLACGPGYFTIPFSEIVGKDGTVYAVDSHPVMIAELRNNLAKYFPDGANNAKIIEADVTKTGIPEHSIDIVFFANVLHDLEDRASFFAETKRIARNQDTLFVDVDWHKRQMDMGPPFERRLSESESREILRSNGFTIIHDVNAGPNHYGLVARINKN